MKTYSKVMLVIVVVLIMAAPLVLKAPNGKPIMDLGDWVPQGDRVVGLLRQALQRGEAVAGDSVEQVKQQTSALVSDNAAVSTAADWEKAPDRLSSSSGKMYKWQDAQGRWHFSSEKPALQQSVSIESLPQVQNVIEAPVNENSNGSMMGIPGLGDVGDVLEKVQRMAAERDQ